MSLSSLIAHFIRELHPEKISLGCSQDIQSFSGCLRSCVLKFNSVNSNIILFLLVFECWTKIKDTRSWQSQILERTPRGLYNTKLLRHDLYTAIGQFAYCLSIFVAQPLNDCLSQWFDCSERPSVSPHTHVREWVAIVSGQHVRTTSFSINEFSVETYLFFFSALSALGSLFFSDGFFSPAVLSAAKLSLSGNRGGDGGHNLQSGMAARFFIIPYSRIIPALYNFRGSEKNGTYAAAVAVSNPR